MAGQETVATQGPLIRNDLLDEDGWRRVIGFDSRIHRHNTTNRWGPDPPVARSPRSRPGDAVALNGHQPIGLAEDRAR